MSRQLLARAWQAGAGPGDSPLTRPGLHHLRDLRTGQGGSAPPRLYRRPWDHPLLAIAAGTGDVLMARLREGQVTPFGAGTPCGRRWDGRYAGARGQLTVRADSGFYTHAIVAVCRHGCPLLHHHPARQPAQSHRGDTRDGLEPIPYWMDGAADVAETTYTPFQSEADAAPVRLIPAGDSRRPVPTGPLRHLQLSRLHHRPGRRNPGAGGDHRRHAEVENAMRPQVRRRADHCRPAVLSPTAPAGGSGRRITLDKHRLAEQIVTTKTLRRRVFALPDGSPARRPHALPQRWPWETQFSPLTRLQFR